MPKVRVAYMALALFILGVGFEIQTLGRISASRCQPMGALKKCSSYSGNQSVSFVQYHESLIQDTTVEFTTASWLLV